LDIRLKLYWECGYTWQEERFEREWCMQCRNAGCSEGNKLYIFECGINSQRFDLNTTNDGEVLIQLNGTTTLNGPRLCLERFNPERDIFLKECDESNSLQRWLFSDFNGDRFEISPTVNNTDNTDNVTDLCITQRHHPKEDEEVEMEPCEQARDGITSYWNRF
jgi:hypothetical protein